MTREQDIHIKVYGDPGLGDSEPAYRMTTKGRDTYILARDGAVLSRTDGPGGWDYAHRWHIVGFGTRANSGTLIGLTDAAEGANVGQGWIHDLDHGTHGMWGSPRLDKLASITRISARSA